MRVLLLFLFLSGCACCPSQDIVVPVKMSNGRNTIVFIKKGDLDNRMNYIPYDEFKKEVQKMLKRELK